MSITAISPHSTIWASATTALGSTAATETIAQSKSNEAGAASPSTTRVDPTRTTPFQQLSSDLQSVLIQMQNAYGDGKDPAAV